MYYKFPSKLLFLNWVYRVSPDGKQKYSALAKISL